MAALDYARTDDRILPCDPRTGVDPETFFPVGSQAMTAQARREFHARVAHAQRLCGRCPVQLACRRYALANGVRFGVWGGILLDDLSSRVRTLLLDEVRRQIA